MKNNTRKHYVTDLCRRSCLKTIHFEHNVINGVILKDYLINMSTISSNCIIKQQKILNTQA